MTQSVKWDSKRSTSNSKLRKVGLVRRCGGGKVYRIFVSRYSISPHRQATCVCDEEKTNMYACLSCVPRTSSFPIRSAYLYEEVSFEMKPVPSYQPSGRLHTYICMYIWLLVALLRSNGISFTLQKCLRLHSIITRALYCTYWLDDWLRLRFENHQDQQRTQASSHWAICIPLCSMNLRTTSLYVIILQTVLGSWKGHTSQVLRSSFFLHRKNTFRHTKTPQQE